MYVATGDVELFFNIGLLVLVLSWFVMIGIGYAMCWVNILYRCYLDSHYVSDKLIPRHRYKKFEDLKPSDYGSIWKS